MPSKPFTFENRFLLLFFYLDSHIYTILTVTYNSDLTNSTNITYNTNNSITLH